MRARGTPVWRNQLKTIGTTPSEVTYLAFSHLRFDHTGNANAFASASWILNKNEIAWAEAAPTPSGIDPAHQLLGATQDSLKI